MSDVFGTLDAVPATSRPDLLAEPVLAAIGAIPEALVAAIDPAYADTENLCAQYGVPMEASANAVIVRGTRAGVDSHACCMTLAHRRVDVNNVVRRRLNARKASFAPMDFAVEATGMEYGGINPIGLPDGWPILIDEAVVSAGPVVIGGGVRGSKILLDGADLARLPGAKVIPLALSGA